ncbi:hypothetical protein GCM10027447_18250 [Glycomyces halotolerans]
MPPREHTSRTRSLLLAAGLTLLWHVALFGAAELIPDQSRPHLGAALVTLCTLPVLVLAALVMGNWRYSGLAPVGPRPPASRTTRLLSPLFLVSLVYVVPGIEGGAEVLLYLAFYCLVVGLIEESLSRGLVQRLLAPLGHVPAAVWVGILFGLGHALSGLWFGRELGDTLFQVVSTAAFGFGYAAARFHLATVWPLVAAHAVYNFSQFASPGAAPWQVQAAVAVGFVAYGIWLLRLLGRDGEPSVGSGSHLTTGSNSAVRKAGVPSCCASRPAAPPDAEDAARQGR